MLFWFGGWLQRDAFSRKTVGALHAHVCFLCNEHHQQPNKKERAVSTVSEFPSCCLWPPYRPAGVQHSGEHLAP
jgi:hypothetical protein